MSDSPADGSRSGSRPSRPLLLAGLGVVGLVLVGVALWALFRSDAPAAVDLDTATAELAGDADTGADGDGAVDDAAGAETAGDDDSLDDGSVDDGSVDDGSADDGSVDDGSVDDGSAGANGAVSDVSGTWTIDTTIGEFSFENSTGTYVGFRVDEELTTVGVTEAVGRTPNVSGAVTIDGQTVTATEIEADMTAITTDISQRDGAARRALDTSNFPTATFVLTEPIDLGADPASGDPVSATAVGDLTIRDMTKSVEVAIDAQLVGDTIAIVGTTDVVFADYGVNAPSAPVVVRLDDFGVIEFQLFLTKE